MIAGGLRLNGVDLFKLISREFDTPRPAKLFLGGNRPESLSAIISAFYVIVRNGGGEELQ